MEQRPKGFARVTQTVLIAEIDLISNFHLPVKVAAALAFHLSAYGGGLVEVVKSGHAAPVAEVQIFQPRVKALVQNAHRFQRFHAEQAGVQLRR